MEAFMEDATLKVSIFLQIHGDGSTASQLLATTEEFCCFFISQNVTWANCYLLLAGYMVMISLWKRKS